MQTKVDAMMQQYKKRIVGSKLFWSLMAVFYALFAVREVLSVQFSVTLYLVCVAVMAFLFNEVETKALIISFIPFVPGFQSKYAVLICMVMLLLKYGKRMRVSMYMFLLPMLMIWEFMHLLGDGYSSIAEFLSGFAPLMCLVVVMCLPNKGEDSSFYTRVYAVSAAVAFSILLISTVTTSGTSLLTLIQEGFRLGSVEVLEVGHKIVYNANGLGYLCNLGIAGLFINIYFKSAKKIDYVLLAFLTVIGCLTVSRTFLLCLVGTVCLYILLQQKPPIYKIKTFLIIGVVIVAAFVAMKIALPNVIENYLERFNADDITGGRSKLLDFYNEFITSSPKSFWYGIGIQRIPEKIWALKGIEIDVPHNGYQQMIVAWGVIGLALMMVFLLFVVLHARKRNPRALLMCYLPLILLFTNILAGQFVTSGSKMLSLVFICLLISNGQAKWIGKKK